MKKDWREYNNQLVKREELLISPEVLSFGEKHKQKKKRGRPITYPEPLIRMLLFIKFALRLPYRQTQGFAQKLLSLLGIKVPNFRTLHYRFSKMDINLRDFPEPQELPEDFVLILDSTGLKVTNRGEWLRKKHGKKAKKGWIKVHEVTDERTQDCQKAKKLVEGAKKIRGMTLMSFSGICVRRV